MDVTIPRLSQTERAILEQLVTQGDSFGLQIVERSRGAVKRGTVYVTLGRMQQKGLVVSRTEASPLAAIGLPRRLYRPTAYGVALLDTLMRAARTLAQLRTREA